MTAPTTSTAPRTATALPTLPEVLRLRARTRPDDTAYVFLRNGEEPERSLTYRQLDERARALATGPEIAAVRAAGKSTTGAAPAAVLLYPSGLDFVAALLGCMYAGVAGAPVQVPSRARGLTRLRRIADDAGTTTVLTTSAVQRDLEERFGDSEQLTGLTLVATDVPGAAPPKEPAAPPAAHDIALLQYTSGSTGDPKGVRVTHANFRANVAETDLLWPCRPDSAVVNWLPLFHDMGMLFGVVLPLWAGIPAYLMSPEAFIRRPGRWLEAISRFRGSHTAAPSFAYELCVRDAAESGVRDGLDLSSLRVAANGAEPVRWGAVRAFTRTFAAAGFRAEAMCPGYGLAENTLKATGSREDRPPTLLRLDAESLRTGRAHPVDDAPAGPDPSVVDPSVVDAVGCGTTVGATTVRVADPGTGTALPEDTVGEIWVSGPCVADGYHGRGAESAATFRARLTGAEHEGDWLRTGDLGFLHDGELFVTGRLKDVIIRKGRNFFPQDIEASAEHADPALRPNCAAAFSVDDGSAELLVLVVEADGRALRDGGAEGLRARVRRAVREGQRLEPDTVVVVRRGALPKTSSGKVQRRETRRRYTEGEFAAASAAGR
ncbi:fatty acyl-AMP ligase [Streptomyces sp. NPDC048290]|uniref:fatty acyl-AMP ligase n=1 Tax=Streptomyces sp. NPDC048290 TaxID=3155811 RepID=UPI00341D1D7D